MFEFHSISYQAVCHVENQARLIMCSGTLSGVWFYLLSSDSIFVQTWLQLLLGCLVTSHIILKCLVGWLLTDAGLRFPIPFYMGTQASHISADPH